MQFLPKVYWCLKLFDPPTYEINNRLCKERNAIRLDYALCIEFINRWTKLERRFNEDASYIDEKYALLLDIYRSIIRKADNIGDLSREGHARIIRQNVISKPLNLGVICQSTFEGYTPKRAFCSVDHWKRSVLYHIERDPIDNLVHSNLEFYKRSNTKRNTRSKKIKYINAYDLINSYEKMTGIQLAEGTDKFLDGVSNRGFFIRTARAEFMKPLIKSVLLESFYSEYAEEYNRLVLIKKLGHDFKFN